MCMTEEMQETEIKYDKRPTQSAAIIKYDMQKYELSLKCQNVTAAIRRRPREMENLAEGINKSQSGQRGADSERRVWD